MTVIEYTLFAGLIGLPVGFMYGVIFGIFAFLDYGIKEAFGWFFTCQILSPIFISLMIFIFMGFFSLFHPNLTLL